MNALSVILDFSVLFIAILVTATSIKRGLVISIIEFVGEIISAVVASFVGYFIVIIGYNSIFKNNLLNLIGSAVSSPNGFTGKDIFDVLPSFINNALTLDGVNSSNLLTQSGVNGSSTTRESIEQYIAPYAISYMTKIAMVMIFTVLLIIIITLSSKFSKHFVNTELKTLNNAMSCIFGLVKSAFIIMVLIVLVDAIVLTMDLDTFSSFNSAVNSSVLFKLLYNVNIPSFIISIVTGV